ncbi:MAG TPA: tryptophan 7-halogenase [Terracidiphilus sp.]|nr:tryptophan 7-halogenase [Terracidiphilus sp.]
MKERFDIAVAGSGFAGSLMAMIARQLGLSVILLERGRHPRVVIGESSTPLSNLLLEELAARYGLANLRTLCKWGSWRESHPELACGLKRGFSFFHHPHGHAGPVARENQLLVAASPHDAIADTHWYRADFDAYLVDEARRLGTVYLDEVELREFAAGEQESRLTGSRHGREIEIAARFVVDATGPRGFLHRALGLGELELPCTPATSALYSHFSGVRRLEETAGIALPDEPPYPVDDAAVHHVFEGGWVWVLRFCNGVTSAGIAAAEPLAQELRLADGDEAWQRLLRRIPVLREQFLDARAVQPFRYIPRLRFRSAAIAGRNWALLPSAAGFVDPLLSTGFPLTLLGVERLAGIFEQDWESENLAARLNEYARKTDEELLATDRLIGALYANFGNFPVFSAVSLLYFAAASYAEAARRLGRAYLASSFLLHDLPQFGPDCARVLRQAQAAHSEADRETAIGEIRRLIEPLDVAGLTDIGRRNWYPADAEDLMRASCKLGASREEVLQMLQRCGFSAPACSRA